MDNSKKKVKKLSSRHVNLNKNYAFFLKVYFQMGVGFLKKHIDKSCCAANELFYRFPPD